VLLVTAIAFVALSTSAQGSTKGCSRAMTQLLDDIKRPAAATSGLAHGTVRRSLGACSTPSQWRTQAGRLGIAAALAPLLHDPGLETDRALDRLCSVFDAYQSTYVCKHRLDQ
jgi:hypothetical protein